MRTTKEIITPIGKHKIVLYDYVIGREIEEIEDIYMAEQKEGDKSTFRKAAHKSIEMLVVSIDEKDNKILDRMLDFRREDYRAVIEEITKIIEVKGGTDKKKVEN